MGREKKLQRRLYIGPSTDAWIAFAAPLRIRVPLIYTLPTQPSFRARRLRSFCDSHITGEYEKCVRVNKSDCYEKAENVS